jgi:hypothetical protein
MKEPVLTLDDRARFEAARDIARHGSKIGQVPNNEWVSLMYSAIERGRRAHVRDLEIIRPEARYVRR